MDRETQARTRAKRKTTDEVVEGALREMFKRVGAEHEFSLKYCEQEDWYKKRTWTYAEEAEFRKWLVPYLAKEMRTSKKRADREASWFLLMWGWMCRDKN